MYVALPDVTKGVKTSCRTEGSFAVPEKIGSKEPDGVGEEARRIVGDLGSMLRFGKNFRRKIGKKLAFLTQSKAKLCKNLIITLLFEKKTPFFIAENCPKLQKNVNITSVLQSSHFDRKLFQINFHPQILDHILPRNPNFFSTVNKNIGF
jgi:hypothetical protein